MSRIFCQNKYRILQIFRFYICIMKVRISSIFVKSKNYLSKLEVIINFVMHIIKIYKGNIPNSVEEKTQVNNKGCDRNVAA